MRKSYHDSLNSHICHIWHACIYSLLSAYKNGIQTLLANWKSHLMKSLVSLYFRINSNVDLIVPGVELLLKLNITPGNYFNHDQLYTLDHLQETFSHFFRKGSAAERAFMDDKLFRKIVSEAEKLSNPKVC